LAGKFEDEYDDYLKFLCIVDGLIGALVSEEWVRATQKRHTVFHRGCCLLVPCINNPVVSDTIYWSFLHYSRSFINCWISRGMSGSRSSSTSPTHAAACLLL